MKILNVAKEKDGCWMVRNDVPFSELKKRGHIIEDTTEETLPKEFDYDIIHFNRSIPTIEWLLKEIKDRGIKIIHDTDDAMTLLNETNPFSTETETRKAVSNIPLLLKYADMVTTSTLPLKAEIERVFKGKVVHLPNCIRLSDWPERPKKNTKLRIGYAGSIAHAEDLNLILPVIAELQPKYGFEFVLFGITYGNLKYEFKKLKKDVSQAKVRIPKWVYDFLEAEKSLSQIKYTHMPLVPIDKYPQTLASLDLDIGLCPLVDSRFNRSKSSIKFYEYSAVSTLTVASRVTPYKEEVNLMVKNRYDKWTSLLSKLIEDEDLRDKLLSEQKAYVKEKADIGKNGHLWAESYQSILN